MTRSGTDKRAAGGMSADPPGGDQTAPVPPWKRNEGKYDRPSSSVPRPRVVRKPVKPDAPAATSAEEARREMERRALRGVGAIPKVEPVATVEAPLLTGWPAELTVEDGEVAASALAVAVRLLEGEPCGRDPDAIKADHLRQLVERLEALIRQRNEIVEIMRDVRAFAKAIGFDTKAITAVIKMRAQDKTARQEFEAILETYRHVLGIEGPDFVIPLPPPCVPPPAPPKRITAREKASREALMLVDASRMAEAALGLGGGPLP